MKLEIFDKPVAVEQLLFEVNPQRVEEFIRLDHELWTGTLEQYPGFAGKEVWVSDTVPGQVLSVIFWEDFDAWKEIDPQVLMDTDAAFGKRFGSGDFRLVGEFHNENQFYKVSQYR